MLLIFRAVHNNFVEKLKIVVKNSEKLNCSYMVKYHITLRVNFSSYSVFVPYYAGIYLRSPKGFMPLIVSYFRRKIMNFEKKIYITLSHCEPFPPVNRVKRIVISQSERRCVTSSIDRKRNRTFEIPRPRMKGNSKPPTIFIQ